MNDQQEETRASPNVSLGEWLGSRPFGLALSSGFFGFFAHAGMTAALFSQGLRPLALSGSSAGALVAAYLAAGMEPEDLGRLLRGIRRQDFWDPAPGPGLLAGRAFRRLLEATLPRRDFAGLGARLAVSAHDLLGHRTIVLDEGDLAEAVHASCAVPVLFHPVRRAGRLLVDGGVSDRPGIAGAPGDLALLAHHLVSRSPWRARPPQPAHGPKTVALAIEGLPRLGPFRLELGPLAFRLAREATLRALELPVSAVIRLPAQADATARPG